MIRVVINLNGLDKKLLVAPERLRVKVYDRLRAHTSALKLRAKRAAPVNSGSLRNAIYGRTYKNPLRAQLGIMSTLRGRTTGFPYALFVAGGMPIRTKSVFNRYFAPNQTVLYGVPAKSPHGKVIWDKESGWWAIIADNARRSYPGVVARGVNDFVKEFGAV